MHQLQSKPDRNPRNKGFKSILCIAAHLWEDVQSVRLGWGWGGERETGGGELWFGTEGISTQTNKMQSWQVSPYLSHWQNKQTWPRFQCTVPWPWVGCPGAVSPSPPRCPARSGLKGWARWLPAWGRPRGHEILAPRQQSPSPAASNVDTKK